MNNNQLVAKALAAATDTVAMEIGIDILDKVPVMFKEQFPEKRALIVNRISLPTNICTPSGLSLRCWMSVWRQPMPLLLQWVRERLTTCVNSALITSHVHICVSQLLHRWMAIRRLAHLLPIRI